MDQRTRRSPARWLAPLAVIAVIVAFAAVVTGSDDEGSTPGQAGTTQSTSEARTGTTQKSGNKAAKRSPAARKTYVVKVGDTLGAIADKTGVPLQRLEELNPDVDSHLMTAGQKIKLR